MLIKNLIILTLYILIFLSPYTSSAQNLQSPGIPNIINYVTEEDITPGKIWQIKQAPNGILYMAGDMGLLEFDGKEWKNYKGSKSFTRSIQVINNSLIYTGSDLDFGVWKKINNTFQYKSLYPFKENSTEIIEEFWFTLSYNKAIIFASFDNLYLYENEHLTKITIPNKISRLFKSKDKVYLLDEKGTISEFNGLGLTPIFKNPSLEKMDVVRIINLNDKLTIFTRQSGIFTINQDHLNELKWEISNYIKKDKLFSFSKLNENYFLLGTILNGLYIIDKNGKIIKHVNKQKGLTHNTVLDIFTDAHYNIWLSIDAGISKLQLNSPYTYFPDFNENFGTPKSALLNNDIFYLGTNQGLYTSDWKSFPNIGNENKFNLIPESEGQVWTIKLIDDKIMVGHDKGLYQLNNNNLIPINLDNGVLDISPFKNNWLLSGNYNGVNIYKKNENSWSLITKLTGLTGAYQQILTDKNNRIWTNIPNYGILSFELDDNFKVINKVFFPTENNNTNSLLSIKNDTIWFHNKDKNSYYNKNKNKFILNAKRKDQEPFVPNSLRNSNSIKINNEFLFYPMTNGFSFSNQSIKLNPLPHFPTLIRKVKTFNNSEIKNIKEGEKINIDLNNIRFYFISPNSENTEYNYRLKGENTEYSGKTFENTLEFLGLHEGKYKFEVWSKYSNDISEFSFIVNPPWHRSSIAYLCYFLLSLIIILGFRYLHQIRLKKQKKHLLKQQQLSLRIQAEKHRKKLLKEKIEIEKEILLNQIKNKTIELAKSSKKNLKNKHIFTLITEKLDEIEKSPNTVKTKLKVQEIRRTLDEFSENEDQVFDAQIKELNKDFIKKISKKYPKLTQYDIRLATYLKMGMNTKEISEILDVLPSSINVSRSRLRKKLELNKDQDFFEFFNLF